MANPNDSATPFEFRGKVVNGALALGVGAVALVEIAPLHSWLRYVAAGGLAIAAVLIPAELTRAENQANTVLPPHG
jgi:hypothetical protein